MSEEKKVKAVEKKQAEVKVAAEKAEAFKKYLEEGKISGFYLREIDNAVHTKRFESNLPVAGQNLHFMILLDDSVYTILQVLVAEKLVSPDKKEKVAAYLNDLNEQYRMLKYTVDADGNVLLTCCIPAGVPHFEPALVIAILNQIQGHLNALYPDIMKKLWEK